MRHSRAREVPWVQNILGNALAGRRGRQARQEKGSCLSAHLLSQAVCPSFPELQIHLDTCSEFRNKHIQWNSYFMKLLLGAYCKRND